jgi:hypothetical protein
MRSVGVRTGLLGALLGAVMIGAFLVQAGRIGAVEGTPYVVDFPTSGRLNVMLAQGDGQAFATLASDPSLSRPERFAGQTADTRVGVEAAYRAQRPLLGYLAWATSLGRADLVAPAMALWAVVGAGGAVGVLAHLLHTRGFGRPEVALLVLLLPGSVQSLSWLGPELLGVALAFGAWVLVARHLGWAVACLCAAGLVKESFLLFAAVLGLGLLLRREIWRAALMGIPVATYLAWTAVVHQRFDAWPSEANDGRVSGPFEGLADAWDRLSGGEVAVVVFTFALALVAIPFIRDPLSWIVIGSVGFAVVAGWDVWIRLAGINRSMLPAHIAIAVLLLTGVHDPYSRERAARGTDRRDRVGEVDGVVPAG